MTTGTELSLHCPGTGEPRRSETQSNSRVRLDPRKKALKRGRETSWPPTDWANARADEP